MDDRAQLSVFIDAQLVSDVQAAWAESGRKRWEVLEDIVRLGLEQYKALPADQLPGQARLLDAS